MIDGGAQVDELRQKLEQKNKLIEKKTQEALVVSGKHMETLSKQIITDTFPVNSREEPSVLWYERAARSSGHQG